MVAAEQGHSGPPPYVERTFPPITEVAIAVMVLVVIGGVFMAAHMPREVPLLLPIVLLGSAVALLVVNIVLLSRLKDFHWGVFKQVAGWSFAAYLVIAGMLEFTFIQDDVPANVFVVLSGMLAVYAIDIPLLFGFSVARYQDAPEKS